VDVHKGEGVKLMWTHVDRGTEGGVKDLIFSGRHKWMTPNHDFAKNTTLLTSPESHTKLPYSGGTLQ